MKKISSMVLWQACWFSCIHLQAQILTDSMATKETKALYANLAKLAEHHILFGHQHATEYGHGWVGNDFARSDVKSVTGSHPAVIGIDFNGLSGRPDSAVVKAKLLLIKNIEATYRRGGVTTAAWHFINPVSAGGFYWIDTVSKPAVKYIIPGGSFNEGYKKILNNIADVAKACRGKNGEAIPIIFRPFHELDGDWFWWGKSHCTVAEFKTLWQFTIAYLRDSLQVHNFIYAFSPDCKFTSSDEYTERYPGNDWVDITGFDDYADFGRDGKYDLAAGLKKLKIVCSFAAQNGKLAAFTETGLESVADSNWYTQSLLKTLKQEQLKLAYVLVWRNDSKSATHFYTPFLGHASVPDFIKFYNDEYTWFEKDLINLYK